MVQGVGRSNGIDTVEFARNNGARSGLTSFVAGLARSAIAARGAS